jgi:opacity protein-like surface antigen
MRLLLVGALLAATVNLAQAQGPYVGAAGVVSFTNDSDVKVTNGTSTLSYDTGYGFAASAGYDFGGARLEAEYGYKEADLDKLSGSNLSFNITDGKLKTTTGMINGFLDYKSDTPLTMFIGAGAGVIKGEFEGGSDSFDDTVFAYQASLGASIAATRNIKLDLFYRFIGAGSDFESNGIKIDYHSSNIYLGARYMF